MGCFLGCFKVPKDTKRRRPSKKSLLIDRRVQECCRTLQPNRPPKKSLLIDRRVQECCRPSLSPKQITPKLSPAAEVAADDAPAELKYRENIKQGSGTNVRKKVTFDLNVKTYETVAYKEDPDCASKEVEATEEIDERKLEEERVESSPKIKAFPVNHRYQNCESSDDDGSSECGEDDKSDCEFDDEEEEEIGIEENEEESYDSFFSLPIEKEPLGVPEVNSPKPNFAPSPALATPQILVAGGTTKRDRGQFVHPVLNPVENLSQWKEVKVRTAPLKNLKKENISSEQENNKLAFVAEPAIKAKTRVAICSTKQEVSVDASLSNWLPSSETSTAAGPQASNSPRSYSSFSREDRPILGALTIEDMKQSSVTSSPRRSPSRSPPADEIPILGTVGRYWNCKEQGDDSATSRGEVKGIPNATSKYQEDKIVNLHTTPFEVRLEIALRNGVA